MKTAEEVIAEADKLAKGFESGAIVMLRAGRFDGFCIYQDPDNQYRRLRFLELKCAMLDGLTPVGILLSRNIDRRKQIVVSPLDEWRSDRFVDQILQAVSQSLARQEARDQAPSDNSARTDFNFSE